MRNIVCIDRKWHFTKENAGVPTAIPAQDKANWVNLPHTWNAIDGQDGDADYYRGACWYVRKLDAEELPAGEKLFLEIEAANSSADVYLNGEKLAHHDGGYSIWRVELTGKVKGDDVLAICVDNSPNDFVYPQMADFTFYGGLYRDVNLIAVPESHFDLEYYGGPGLAVTPVVEGKDAKVHTEVYLKNAKAGQQLRYVVKAACGCVVSDVTVDAESTANDVVIENAHLWNGRKDPYLYTACVQLIENGKVLDEVSARFGCRSFFVDPEKGFFLNGESYPLRGVSRHQDRWGIGNALLPEHHEEDMQYILELGATTIRLAHYQHDQYFYDLCDEKGLVIWAEIPYISQHMPGGRENTISQMKELITQNYNHASIVTWGLSNEITMKGEKDPDLLVNHEILNDLVHDMDKTRLTTMAVVSMCSMDAPYVQIPDLVSYNHYFGWYGGDTDMNGPWFDNFHAKYPNIPIGVSEYGAEALNWHTSKPVQGDYTEEYQAYYHEELIKQLFTRPYIWATHVWNMYDFGADARNEGGENGQNHKGLMTMDRKYKKDAFFAYKAWLSDDPFVHITGKRYTERVEDVTRVTVYSNLPEVELFANGVSLGKQTAEDHFFRFDVPNAGVTKLHAVAGDCTDDSVIVKVDTFNDAYRLKEKGAILNWFDITEPEGYFSLNDKLGDIMANPAGQQLFAGVMKSMMGASKGAAAGFDIPADAMMQMMNGFTVLRLTSMLGTAGITVTKEQLLQLNAALNQIKK